MILFGITGGIGMGKSTAGNLLLEQEFPLVDTDVIARQIVEPGQPALREIESAFGNSVISPNGELCRDQLAGIVFSDSSARETLQSILHPRIRMVWQQEVERWRSQNKAVGFVTIPLLFETAASDLFDAVICVACSHKTQLNRLKSRGWDDQQIQQRIAAQWPVEKKIAASDYVIWTDTTVEVHAAQLHRILETAA